MPRKYWILLCWISLACFVYVRYLVWFHFSNVFVDSDQTINWLTAVDISNGKFYSPYFYGQFYNNILEALSAAPFIRLGLPVEHVMPVIVTVFGSLPFLIAFRIFYKRNQFELATITLVMALAMPAEYQLITATARGFMGGLVLATMGISLFLARHYWKKALGVSLCLISTLVNPNAAVLLVPIVLYYVLSSHREIVKNWKWYLLAVIAFLTVIFALKGFQNTYAHYEVHQLWTLRFEKDFFIHALKNGDARWCYTLPFLPKNGGLLGILLVALLVVFRLKFKRSLRTWTILGFVLFFGLTLFLNKTLDGSTNVYFPYTRMYLGLPLVYVFFIWLSELNVQRKLGFAIVTIALALGLMQQSNRLPEASLIAVRKNPGQVQVQRIKQLCKSCNEIKDLVNRTEAEALVLHSKSDEYTYGCKALIPTLNTVHPMYERRYWEWEKHGLDTIYSRLLFFDWNLRFDQEITPKSGELSPLKNVQFPAYLLENNNDRLVDIYPQKLLAKRRYIDK